MALDNALKFFRAFFFYCVQLRGNASLFRMFDEPHSALESSEGKCWLTEIALTGPEASEALGRVLKAT